MTIDSMATLTALVHCETWEGRHNRMSYLALLIMFSQPMIPTHIYVVGSKRYRSLRINIYIIRNAATFAQTRDHRSKYR